MTQKISVCDSKAIQGIVEILTVKNYVRRDLLIETSSALQTKSFVGKNVSIAFDGESSQNHFLTRVRGVIISEPDLDVHS
ncbi:hypothetical protein TNCV_484731 [Trichonephila clavipes]|nr:hypothetical protein TNCV_484731 [Trichonephila clavipes]